MIQVRLIINSIEHTYYYVVSCIIITWQRGYLSLGAVNLINGNYVINLRDIPISELSMLVIRSKTEKSVILLL